MTGSTSDLVNDMLDGIMRYTMAGPVNDLNALIAQLWNAWVDV